jgi:1-acyl-sn-glycerol-3-phosphate acyltransferase
MFRMFLMIFTVGASYTVLSLIYLPLFLFDRGGRINDSFLKVFCRLWLWSVGIRLKVHGQENWDELERTRLILAGNHQSTVDIPVLMKACRGRVRFVFKKTIGALPFVGPWLRAMGHVSIDPSNVRSSMSSLIEIVDAQDTRTFGLAFFPEGTRSPDGTLGRFRAGSFTIMKRAGIPVMPFAIEGTCNIQRSNSWRIQGGEVNVYFGAIITAEEVEALHRDELLARTETFIRNVLGQTKDQSDQAADQSEDQADRAALPAQ